MKIFYFGLHAPENSFDKEFIHTPLIETKPLSFESLSIKNFFYQIDKNRHIIITSKECAKYFFQAIDNFCLKSDDLHFLSIGEKTTQALKNQGAQYFETVSIATQEGIIQHLVKNPSLNKIAYPHSSLSRKTIIEYCKTHDIDLLECVLYETLYKIPSQPINLEEGDGVYFTSPSTVQSFSKLFSHIPKHLKIYTEGPITKREIEKVFKVSSKSVTNSTWI